MEAAKPSSPLTTLSAVSTPESFVTAPSATPTNGNDTNISSPADLAQPLYRGARQLPYELCEHVKIFLEEHTFLEATELLHNLLAAGGSCEDLRSPALVPPPNQLSLLATLAIHPAHTSRTREPAQLRIGILSLQYLLDLVATVGPVKADLRTAFDFGPSQRGGRLRESPSHDDLADDGHIRGRFAGASSVWSRGQDFWRVVGWAFNCSVIHPRRWTYWKPWLEMMVDVLEKDFSERKQLDVDSAQDDGEYSFPRLRDSLLSTYLSGCNNRMAVRNIMKAVCADGTSQSTAMFQPVFEHETKGPADSAKKRKRETVLDLENDKFGDYYDEDSFSSSQASASSSPLKPRATRRGRPPKAKATEEPAKVSTGLVESLPLRLRLFYLIASVALYVPDCDFALAEVYDAFSDLIREFPAPTFALYVSPPTLSTLAVEAQVSLLRRMLERYLPQAAPDPTDIDPDIDQHLGISTQLMTECFLPFAANNVSPDSNAKMSLILETLLMIIMSWGHAEWSEELQEAVDQGVRAREDKTRGRRTTAPTDDPAARELLRRSGLRLTTMMCVMRYDHSETDSEGNAA